MKFYYKTLFLIMIISVLLVSGCSNNSSTQKNSGDNIDTPIDTSNAQIVNLKVSGSKYILEPSTVKVNVPVKIIVDLNTARGCSRAITIPTFQVLKYVDSKDNTVVFTPTKTGTFKIACSMNMYTGSFTVTE